MTILVHLAATNSSRFPFTMSAHGAHLLLDAIVTEVVALDDRRSRAEDAMARARTLRDEARHLAAFMQSRELDESWLVRDLFATLEAAFARIFTSEEA